MQLNENRKRKIHRAIKKLLIFSCPIYIIIAASYYWTRPQSIGGDEPIFIRALSFIQEHGWLVAVEKGISIPYMIFTYPLSLFLPNYLALRTANKIILLLFFLYLFIYKENRNLSLYLLLLFYISAAPFYYFGTNDSLFVISLAIFFYETYRASKNKTSNWSLATTALVICIFTRSLFIVYLPVILLGLYVLFKRRKNLKFETFLVPLSIIFFFLLANVPSLKEGHGLSYDRKMPPRGVEATWSQRQYLAQLEQNQGKRAFQSHPSWEETDEYLRKNGMGALPASTFKAWLHDIPLTIKEFFKDLFYIAIYHSRTMGFIVVTVVMYYLHKFLKRKKINFSFFVPITTIVMVLIFSFIIISWVELRWLGAVFLLNILVYNDLEQKKLIPQWAISVNYLFITFLIIYGSYGLILKLI